MVSLYPDLTFGEVRASDYLAIIFIGATQARQLFYSEEVHRIAHESVKHDIVLGGICHGVFILAYSGVLEGKRVTGDGCQLLDSKGAICTEDETYVVDGLLVTTYIDLINFSKAVEELIENR